jgi:hypothetical protein
MYTTHFYYVINNFIMNTNTIFTTINKFKPFKPRSYRNIDYFPVFTGTIFPILIYIFDLSVCQAE